MAHCFDRTAQPMAASNARLYNSKAKSQISRVSASNEPPAQGTRYARTRGAPILDRLRVAAKALKTVALLFQWLLRFRKFAFDNREPQRGASQSDPQSDALSEPVTGHKKPSKKWRTPGRRPLPFGPRTSCFKFLHFFGLGSLFRNTFIINTSTVVPPQTKESSHGSRLDDRWRF